MPTCPAWTVHDLYAHLSGLCGDVIEDELDWPGAPEATAVQVAQRKDWSIGQICNEWLGYAAQIERRFEAEPGALRLFAVDAWTHDQDVHNALGFVSGRAGAGLELTIAGVWRLKRRLRDEGLAPLRVVTEQHDWTLGDGDPGATLRIPAYELARAILGRRSREQLGSYDWDGDPAPYLGMLPFFTPTLETIVE